MEIKYILWIFDVILRIISRAKSQGYATFWATIDNPTHSD